LQNSYAFEMLLFTITSFLAFDSLLLLPLRLLFDTLLDRIERDNPTSPFPYNILPVSTSHFAVLPGKKKASVCDTLAHCHLIQQGPLRSCKNLTLYFQIPTRFILSRQCWIHFGNKPHRSQPLPVSALDRTWFQSRI
jgi:hypothetical protein